MKKLILAIFIALLATSAVFAYNVDGKLSDWGVDLSSAFLGNNDSWFPASATADVSIEDNIHPDAVKCDWTGYCAKGFHTGPEPMVTYHGKLYVEPAGGELSDIEAIYFDDDNQYGYFAIVLSLPPTGHTDRWGRHFNPGDLAIDLDNNVETGEYGYEFGIKTTGEDAGRVCFMPRWTLPWGTNGFVENTPSTMSCDGPNSIDMGKAELVYANTGIEDNGFDNYVIEIKVDRSLLNYPSPKQISNLHTSLTCGNDVIEIEHYKWDYDVPEFSSIGAALVLVGAGVFLYKKRK